MPDNKEKKRKEYICITLEFSYEKNQTFVYAKICAFVH